MLASAHTIRINSAGVPSVVGSYVQRKPDVIPEGFALVCRNMRWDPKKTWSTLSDLRRPWFEAENGAYVYWNTNDRQWWIDEPDGGGVYVAKDEGELPPSKGWQALPNGKAPLPTVSVEKQ